MTSCDELVYTNASTNLSEGDMGVLQELRSSSSNKLEVNSTFLMKILIL